MARKLQVTLARFNEPAWPEKIMSSRAATSRLIANSPAELFHWAAVSFVIALIATVLSFAAGTAGLAEIATLCCYLFAGLGCVLVIAGLRNLRDPRPGHADAKGLLVGDARGARSNRTSNRTHAAAEHGAHWPRAE